MFCLILIIKIENFLEGMKKEKFLSIRFKLCDLKY